jgi:hypothetical protein
MIDFQSSATAENASHRPCHSPSPGGDLSRLGSGERNLAKPKVAWRPSERARASQRRDEGELNLRGRQSALIRVHVPAASVFIRVHPWLKPGLLAVQAGSIQGFPRPFKAIKAYPSLFKGFWKKNYSFGQPSTFNLQLSTFNFQRLPRSTWCNRLRPIPTYWDLFRTPSPPGCPSRHPI